LASGQPEDGLEECHHGGVLACPGTRPANALDPHPCPLPCSELRTREPATSPPHPTAVARRLGVVQATGLGVDINPRIALGQVGVTGVPNQWPLPCERKYDRRLTSGDAAIMPLSPKAARQPERWATASRLMCLAMDAPTSPGVVPSTALGKTSTRGSTWPRRASGSAPRWAPSGVRCTLSARADARAEIDAVILILVRQLRLAQWAPPWERIGGGR
jgi:hypothetical protein